MVEETSDCQKVNINYVFFHLLFVTERKDFECSCISWYLEWVKFLNRINFDTSYIF